MVNSAPSKLMRGDSLLSTGQVMEILGVTKVTLYKWIGLGKLNALKHEIGDRTFLEFDPKEVERVKKLMVSHRKHGKSLLK